MADPVFLARVVAASLVAVALLLGAGNQMNGASASLAHPARHVSTGK